MNNNSSVQSNLSNPITSQFTLLPEYQERENYDLISPFNRLWQSQAKLNPQALDRIEKVKNVLNIVQECIEEPRVFANTPYDVMVGAQSAVIAMRKQVVNTEANEVLQRYQKSQSLAKQVLDITKQVREVAKTPASLEEKKATLLSTLDAISKTLTDFREKVFAEKGALENSPFANDPRCFKKKIKPFDELGLQHQTYLEKIEEWKRNQVIVDNASETDCWKWKGKIKAIKCIEQQCAFLENNLYAVECSLTSLQNNANNQKFHRPLTNTNNATFHNFSHLVKERRVVTVTAITIPASSTTNGPSIEAKQEKPTDNPENKSDQ